MKLDRTTLASARTADVPTAPGPAPVRPCFVVAAAPRPELIGAVIDLASDELVVGRDPLAGIWIDDPGVSRRHARIIRREDGGHAIADLGSLNGTYVNGVRVRSAPLASGDRVQIGTATSLRYGARAEPDLSDLRLRQAVAAGAVGTWTWDAAGDHLVVGPESERLLGIPAGQGLRAWDLVHPDDRAGLGRALAASLARSEPLRIELRLVLGDGATRRVALRGEGLVDGAGRTRRMAGALEELADGAPEGAAAQADGAPAPDAEALLASATAELERVSSLLGEGEGSEPSPDGGARAALARALGQVGAARERLRARGPAPGEG
jgi:PAS domain-containing protein